MMIIAQSRPFYEFLDTRAKTTTRIYTYYLAVEGKMLIERNRGRKFVVLSKTFGHAYESINLKQFVYSVTHGVCMLFNEALFVSLCIQAATCLLIDLTYNAVELTPVCDGRLCKEQATISYEFSALRIQNSTRECFQGKGIELDDACLRQFITNYMFVASDKKLVEQCSYLTKFYARPFEYKEGKTLTVNRERFEPFEAFFDARTLNLYSLVFYVVERCVKEVRQGLLQNIWIAGCLTPGFGRRLHQELRQHYTNNMVSLNVDKALIEQQSQKFGQLCTVRAVTDEIIVSSDHVLEMLPNETSPV